MAQKAGKKAAPARHTGDGSKSTTGRITAKHPPTTPNWGVRHARSTPPVARAFEAKALLALPELPQPDRGQAINLGIIAGTDGPTGWLGVGATDLCEIAPSGQVALAGDTFPGNCCGCGPGCPSMGLHVKPGTLNSNTIQFDRAFGQGGTLYAEPPPHVDHGNPSQLPAGTIRVFGIDYALVTRTVDLQPIDSRLVRINPDAGYWPTVPGSCRGADWQWGNQTQISGCQAPDGWVYIVADGFARDHKVVLYHCRAETFENRDTWWAWARVGEGPDWAWDQPGVPPTPLNVYNNDVFGELSLRIIEDKFVLSAFNATTGNIEVRVTDDVTQVLASPDRTPVTVVATQSPDSVPNNYGGYIVPGSTLDQALILVSRWSPPNYPYNVQEFVVNLNR
nr:DUF4185 domain-containing protein [Mycobacterium sp. E2497]